MKTNAMRQLDQAKISYETLEYDLDKDLFSGEKVSDLLGLDYSQCYKTLALKHEHDLYICVISVKDELDLKKCAKACAVKNVEMRFRKAWFSARNAEIRLRVPRVRTTPLAEIRYRSSIFWTIRNTLSLRWRLSLS